MNNNNNKKHLISQLKNNSKLINLDQLVAMDNQGSHQVEKITPFNLINLKRPNLI